MGIESAPERLPSPRADLIWAAVWIALGGAIVAGSWTMDRLEAQGATVYSMPGLVPGFLGAAILFMGLLLGLRALRAGGGSRVDGAIPAGEDAAAARANRTRVGGMLVLTLGYAVGLVGRGVAFWLATFVFVFAFIVLFEWPDRRARAQVPRGLAVAGIVAAATAAVVSVVFEQVFLVRLP